LHRFTFAGKHRLAYEYGKCRGIEGGIRQWERCVAELIEDGTILTVDLWSARRRRAFPLIVLLERIDEHLDAFNPDRDCLICLVLDPARDLIDGQPSLPRRECPHSEAQREAALARAKMRHPCRNSADTQDANSRHPCRNSARRHPLEVLKENTLKRNEAETTTTAQGRSRESHAREAAGPAESSSSKKSGERESGSGELRTRDPSIEDAVVAKLVDQAARILTGERPAELPGKIRAAIQADNPGWWIRNALVAVNRMTPRDGGKRHWGMVLRVLANFRLEGKPLEEPAPPPDPHQAALEKRARDQEQEKIQTQHDKALEAALRAAWDRLPETQRESIRAKVEAENPTLVRWPKMLEPLYLAAIAAAQAAAETEPGT
jgi:hypothetical protein